MATINVTNNIGDFSIRLEESEGRFTVTIDKYNSNAKEVTVPAIIAGMPVTAIGENAFSFNDSLTSLMLPDGLVSVGWAAFTSCTGLVDIKLPQSLTSIEAWAFDSCEKLISITIPKNTVSIGNAAFTRCSSLKEIAVDKRNTVYASNEGVLFDKKMTTLLCYPQAKQGDYVIPDSVHTIRSDAFEGCRELTGISFPKDIIRISTGFTDCERLTKFTVNEKSKYFTVIDGVLFNKEKEGPETALLCHPQGRNNKKYTVPVSVTAILDSAFCKCKRLTSIILPDGLEFIDDNAFYGCQKLSELSLPASLEYIGELAFDDCPLLKTVTLSRKTKMGHKALDGFTGKLIYRD